MYTTTTRVDRNKINIKSVLLGKCSINTTKTITVRESFIEYMVIN